MLNMKKYKTNQESLWAGRFGNEYTLRNRKDFLIPSNRVLFAKIFSTLPTPIHSLIEFGAGTGNNLIAIRSLLPNIHITAVDINSSAVKQLKKIEHIEVINKSIIGLSLDKTFDFVLTKGVLINQSPKELPSIYNLLYNASNKFICLAEYYNPIPIELPYRGHKGLLIKRDFAGEMMDMHKDLSLVDYGFAYHRDNNFFQDDITWFLMRKP